MIEAALSLLATDTFGASLEAANFIGELMEEGEAISIGGPGGI